MVASAAMPKGIYARFKVEIATYRAALRHPRTPTLAKWLLRAAIAYALSPIDLIPDFIPVLGHLDDAIIVPGLVLAAVRLIPRDVMDECREQAAGESGRPEISPDRLDLGKG